MDDLGLGTQVVTQLLGAQHKVVEVTAGKSFRRLSKQRYEIRPGCRADYDALLWEMQKRGGWPQKIMHLWSVLREPSSVSLDDALELSFFSLLNLAQTLADNNLSGADVAIVSSSLQCVGPGRIVAPGRAALLGPATVIPQELPNVVCRSIDCDPAGQGTSYVAVQIITEHCSPFRDSMVAYRGKRRFVQSMEPLELGRISSGKRLETKGVYLITGGLGHPGIATATFLARSCRAKLVLLDNKDVPPSKQWRDELQSDRIPAAKKEIIRQLMAIQELGSEIRTVHGDVAKSIDLQQAVVLAVREFGKINGAIHAARVSENRTSNLKTREGANSVLQPTIRGLVLLDELLRPHSPEFIVALSTAASLRARSGHIDKVAADCFLNTYATSNRDRSVFAINCDFWPLENPSTRKRAGQDSHSVQANEANISSALFTKTLEFFFNSDSPPVVVCTGHELRPESGFRLQGTTTDTQDAKDRELEGQLSLWWREFLGLDHVDLDDDFFDLGGHSIIGVQLLSELKKNYGLDLGLSVLFEARTVRQLAAYIRKSDAAGSDEPISCSPLVPIQPKGNLAPLFVISGLGGNVIKFHNLAFHLGENQPVFGLLPRGLDGKDSFHTRIEEMAADYVAAIRSAQPQGPYHLVGYSFGGIVAFEVAQQILAMGDSVALLGLFDTIEWHYLLNLKSRLSPIARLKSLYDHFRRALLEQNGFDYLKKVLNSRSSRLKNRSANADMSSLPSRLESIEQVNILAAHNYKPRVYPGRLTLFRSTQRVGHEGNDELLGWGRLVTGGVELQHVNSTHFDILREPAVIELAQKLKSHLPTVPA